MKTKLIINPVSARGKMKSRWNEIDDALHAEDFPFELVFTERRGHATELARAAVAEGFDLIVAVGGDGTMNEVLNGMIAENGIPLNPNAVLGIIPSGTGSDLARTLGLPHDRVNAAHHLAHARTARPIDVGEIVYCVDGKETNRYFANVAGMGFDAEVIERTEVNGKHGGGTIPYLMTLITTISVYKNKSLVLHVDDRQIPGRMNSVIVCNGKYFGGGMKVGPNASLDDGLFHVITIGDMTTFEVLTNTQRIYTGTHLTHPKVSEYQARIVRVEPEERMMIEADGELIGPGPATFRIHPALMRLWV